MLRQHLNHPPAIGQGAGREVARHSTSSPYREESVLCMVRNRILVWSLAPCVDHNTLQEHKEAMTEADGVCAVAAQDKRPPKLVRSGHVIGDSRRPPRPCAGWTKYRFHAIIGQPFAHYFSTQGLGNESWTMRPLKSSLKKSFAGGC